MTTPVFFYFPAPQREREHVFATWIVDAVSSVTLSLHQDWMNNAASHKWEMCVDYLSACNAGWSSLQELKELERQ